MIKLSLISIMDIFQLQGYPLSSLRITNLLQVPTSSLYVHKLCQRTLFVYQDSLQINTFN